MDVYRMTFAEEFGMMAQIFQPQQRMARRIGWALSIALALVWWFTGERLWLGMAISPFIWGWTRAIIVGAVALRNCVVGNVSRRLALTSSGRISRCLRSVLRCPTARCGHTYAPRRRATKVSILMSLVAPIGSTRRATSNA